MSDEQKKEAQQSYTALFRKAWDMAVKEGYDLLVIDEFMSAYQSWSDRTEAGIGMSDEASRLSGSSADRQKSREELLKLADYVTEMKKIKHPFDQGIPLHVKESEL